MILDNLHYNYVFLDSEDRKLKRDYKGYRYICSKDLEQYDNVQLVTYPLDYAPFLFRLLFLVHHSVKINRFVKLPFKQMWYRFYFKKKFDGDKPICFVVSGRYATVDYLRYLKRMYADCKIVKMHRDLYHLWKQRNPSFTDEIIKELFDLSVTYDYDESIKYHMGHFDEFESKMAIPKDKKYPLHDVFFAGRAKDRLGALMRIYNNLRFLGLKPYFYITDVPEKDRIQKEGIVYADKNMPYYDMLYQTVNSKYLLEINQRNATGFTSRFLEAVIYNKKLISNNRSIAISKFYNPKYIFLLDESLSLEKGFFESDFDDVDYNYDDEFSPTNVIRIIDSLLGKERTKNEND